MTALILTPPIAFVLYMLLSGLLLRVSHRFAASSPGTAMKSTTYGSGETAPSHAAAAGYRTFFVIALFFAVLHLGTLMLGTSNLLPISGVYVAGLALILLVLILG